MNPLFFMTKVMGITIVAAAGASYFWKKFGPNPEDVMAGMIHLKKSAEEFQKGFEKILGMESGSSSKAERDSKRIPIE